MLFKKINSLGLRSIMIFFFMYNICSWKYFLRFEDLDIRMIKILVIRKLVFIKYLFIFRMDKVVEFNIWSLFVY